MGVKVTNNAFGTLSAAINTTATTITLDSGQGARFPTLGASDYFFGTIVDTSNNLEIVKVTARSTDSLTVVRGQDGTTATAFAIGDRFELRPTAALFEDIIDNANVDGISSASTSGTAITIDSSNNVGINEGTPEHELHVSGTQMITNASESSFLVLHSTTADQQVDIKYDHKDSTSYGGNGIVTFEHSAAGTVDTMTVRADQFSADHYRVGSDKSKMVLQVLAIDSSTSTNITNTSWNSISGSFIQVTVKKAGTMRQYFCIIPGEIDSDAGNVFARVYKKIGSGSWTAFSTITNFNFTGAGNGTVNSSIHVLDTTSHAAGTVLQYRVYVRVQKSSSGLELGQNNLSGNTPANNNIQGYLIEYDHS
jgi:hypothetical protein